MRRVVARVGRAHGIRGEVTIEVRTDEPERRFVPGAEFSVQPPERAPAPAPVAGSALPATLTLAGVRDHNGTLLLSFDGIADRNAAEGLRGAVLEADLPDRSDEPDAWYDHELIGLRAQDPAGEPLGVVEAVEHPPAQDLLVIRRPDGQTRWVPFVTALVPTVDVDGGRLVIDAPPGLLSDVPDDGPEGEP